LLDDLDVSVEHHLYARVSPQWGWWKMAPVHAGGGEQPPA